MKSEKIEFPGSQQEPISARLDTPDSRSAKAWGIFAHCFTCSKSIKAVMAINKALTAEGYGMLRFDFTGLGESGGNFADSNFTSNIQELYAAVDWLKENREAPGFLVGHSLGGSAVLHAAGNIESVKAVATIGAPYDPAHVTHIFEESIETIEKYGEAMVNLSGRRFKIKKQFLEDLKEQEPEKVIGSLKKALIVFHSPIDQTVGIENAALIFTAAKHPKSFVSLDNADHLLFDKNDSSYVGQMIAPWVKRYLR